MARHSLLCLCICMKYVSGLNLGPLTSKVGAVIKLWWMFSTDLSLSSSLFMPHMEHMQRCIMGQWNWNVLALSLILHSSTYNLTSWYLSGSYFFLLCPSLLMKETASAFQSYSAKKLVSCKKSNTYAARFDTFLALECRGVVLWNGMGCGRLWSRILNLRSHSAWHQRWTQGRLDKDVAS